MALTELQDLRDSVARAEARMLEIRRNPSLHGELKNQQAVVKAVRAELQAYEKSHAG